MSWVQFAIQTGAGQLGWSPPCWLASFPLVLTLSVPRKNLNFDSLTPNTSLTLLSRRGSSSGPSWVQREEEGPVKSAYEARLPWPWAISHVQCLAHSLWLFQACHDEARIGKLLSAWGLPSWGHIRTLVQLITLRSAEFSPLVKRPEPTRACMDSLWRT